MVKQRKVLVADDDRITREIIGAILTRAGHEVVFAEDGKSALEKASTEKPDLVFIDGLMPKMHGFLACKAIKELDRPPKVILLTGIYTKPAYEREAKGTFGADDLLRKPSSPEELLACIEKHLPSETKYLDASEIQTEEHDQPIEDSRDSGIGAGANRA